VPSSSPKRKRSAPSFVTGAYRHNQIIEWFMGGTTRHILAAADIPLLMAH
jgi:nucleotide-binding universal stress UspA family protein